MRKRKNSAKKWFFGLAVFIIAIMIGSSLLMALDDSGPTGQKYNGFHFTYQNNQWVTEINNQKLAFYFHPSEIDYLEIPNAESLNSPSLYISFDPEDSNEYLDLSRLKLDLAAQSSESYFIHGITRESELYSLPTITCANATAFTPVLLYQESNQTQIQLEQNCYLLQTQTKMDYLKLTERIIYQILGVING